LSSGTTGATSTVDDSKEIEETEPTKQVDDKEPEGDQWGDESSKLDSIQHARGVASRQAAAVREVTRHQGGWIER